MPDAERLRKAIPVGEDRAEAAAEIWRRYDLGALASMRQMLNQLTGSRPGPSRGFQPKG